MRISDWSSDVCSSDLKATSADTLIYRSRVYDCKGCELKSLCCPNTTHRKIARQVNEAARDVARQIAATPRYQQSRKDRKKVEMLFAHLKRILRLDRLRLRGQIGSASCRERVCQSVSITGVGVS